MATDTGSDELNDVAQGQHNRLAMLGKYRIVKRIGSGGMGTVFLAVDDSLHRTVALKVLPRDRADNPTLVKRFKAEGQAAAHMEHPNIVRVFEAGEADGYLYMALEYVEGIDVYELVERRGVVPIKRSTDIIKQTARALQHAYERGIVHRDIKPSNLLIKRDGSVKLADMGLARSVDETLETNITRAGTTVGTVDYMAPEQARSSKSADVRSDIYSLGCTWYHMLTGHPPFHEGSMTTKLQAHALSPRPDPRAENDQVPEGIVAIIQRMMARKPDDRYQTPQELLDDLEAAGRMHRNMDESALAALANEATDADDWQPRTDETDPVMRLADIDDVDLASLKDSAEYDLDELSSKPNPIKPKGKSKPKPTTTVQPTSPPPQTQASSADNETAEFDHGTLNPATPATRAFPPIEPETPQKAPVSARRTPASRPEAQPANRTLKTQTKAKSESTRKPSPRPAKRGSVTRAGGAAPELPAKDAPPVDASSGKDFDLASLKVVIPVLLAVTALAAIGYAILNGGDVASTGGGLNPYADGQPVESPTPPVVVPQQADPVAVPDAAVANDPAEAPRPIVATDFPGAEDAPAPAANERPLVPDWVEAFRHPSGGTQQTLKVRRRPEGNGQVATIDEAIKKLPGEGGTIEIDGDGPFRFDAVTVTNCRHLRIQAADGRHPVIQLRPTDKWTSGSLVTFRGMQVEFEGIHFVLVDAGPAGGDLFAIEQGNLAFRNGSITVDRRQAEPLTALRIQGAKPSGGEPVGRCLLENVVIRGSDLTSVLLDGPSAELVTGDCLLASGNAPTIVLDDRGADAAARNDEVERGVRLLATTILAGQSAITWNFDGSSGGPVPTDLILRDSIVARQSASGGGPSPTLARQIGWLAEPQNRDSKLTWQADQCTFIGWSNLLTLEDAGGRSLGQTPESWNQVTRDVVVPEPIASAVPASLTPESVHAALAAIVKRPARGEAPGLRPDQLPPLPTGLIEHVVAAMRQPLEPSTLGAGMRIEGKPVRFDLSLKRSLSHFLEGDAVPTGTHVIAFGAGPKEVEPFVIENKSIRLEFEHNGASPLVIQPTAARDGAAADEAFITIRNGTLDLVGATLKLPASRKSAYPKSALLTEHASLSVRHCALEGPRADVDAALPLIRVAGSSSNASEQNVLVENSFLVGQSSLIAGPIQWKTLILRNCVLASDSDAVVANAETQGLLPAALVIDHCTIAAGGAAVRVAVTPSAAAAGPLTIYARASVFAGPVGDGQGTSVVVAHSAGAAHNGSLVWWGSANGYSDRLGGAVIDGAGQPAGFGRDWTRDWGAGHEANPLTGKAGVLFRKAFPELRRIEPSDFALADSAPAASWGPQHDPLGALLESIGPAAESRPAASSSPSPASRPTRNKNNPGF